MRKRIIITIISGIAVVIIIVGGGVVYQRQQHRRPEAVIDAWASAAEVNDASRMRELMEPNAFLFATWRERWSSIRQTLQVQPGYAISGITQRGDTTAATVHFRTADGAVCVPVLIDAEGKVVIAGMHSFCPFPAE